MWRDELTHVALNTLPPLIIGTAAARLIFEHPGFWAYLLAINVAGGLMAAVRGVVGCLRNREEGASQT